MNKAATPETLDKAIMAELDEFAGSLKEDIVAAQKAAAKKVIRDIKANAPGKGKYAKGWKSKTTQTRTGAETIIYQGDLPGLAHLLEYGHPIVSGGRTVGQAKAFQHIDPAAEAAADYYEQELGREIEK